MTIETLLNKTEKFHLLTQSERVKVIAYFYCVVFNKIEFSATEVKKCFIDENLDSPSNIHREISILTNGRPPTLIKKGDRYTFHRDKWKELNELYLDSKHSREISTSLRGLIVKINSPEQKIFLDEVIICFEVKCYRASIIMTWLLVMDILYVSVLRNSLLEFNMAIQAHGQYKKIIITKKEDFSDLKESIFLELLRVSKIISGDEFKILKDRLDFRNTAAHPNTITIKESRAIAFIEDLIENIITKFQ